MIRLIHMINDKHEEEIIFTEDFETSAHDFCKLNFKVCFDKKLDIELPAIFPLECVLKKI